MYVKVHILKSKIFKAKWKCKLQKILKILESQIFYGKWNKYHKSLNIQHIIHLKNILQLTWKTDNIMIKY